ncbi:hypothetical protein CU098_001743, partial [Rhizopus stolonifer]
MKERPENTNDRKRKVHSRFRGRREAAKTRQETRKLFWRLLNEPDPQWTTITRALLLFYQPQKDHEAVVTFVRRLNPEKLEDKKLKGLLIEKIILDHLSDLDCCRLLVSVGCPASTRSMIKVREATMTGSMEILDVFYLDWIQPELLKPLTMYVFTQPFLLDHLSVVPEMVARLPLNDWLEMVIEMVEGGEIVEDEAVAGLLMNLTEICQIEQARYLKKDDVLTNYIKAVQLLLTRLPVSYLADPVSTISVDQVDTDSDSDDDQEDIVMTETIHSNVPPRLRERLELLYETERINAILSKCIQLTTLGTDVIRYLSSFINTLLLRWPSKKGTILNTLSYKSSTLHHLIDTLWQSWSVSKEAQLFGQEQSIMHRLNEAESLLTDADSTESWSILYLLCEIHARILLTITDNEFLNDSSKHHPFSLKQIIQSSRELKNISFVMFWRASNLELTQEISHSGIQLSQLRTSVTHLLQQIHMRDSRRSFCPTDHWLIPDLNTDNFSSAAVAEEFHLESDLQENLRMSKGRLAVISPRLGLLNNIPFVVPFEQRVEIFRQFIQNDKQRNLDDRFGARVNATIRRNHIFEDGFNAFHTLDAGIKDKVAISFVDEFG